MITGLVAFLNVLRGEKQGGPLEVRRGVGRLLRVLSQWAHERGLNHAARVQSSDRDSSQ